jgi:hypothetical protein
MRQMLSEPGRVRRDALSIQLLIGEGLLAFIHVFSICVVGAILFVSVDEIEPDRRLVLVLKFLIVFVSIVAIAGRLMRYPQWAFVFLHPYPWIS